MKHKSNAGIATFAAWMLALTATAQSVPNLINYQGRLTDQSGAPMAAGAYGIQFRLWDLPANGNLIWGQQQTVTVQTNGVFDVILGSGGSIAGTTPAVTD